MPLSKHSEHTEQGGSVLSVFAKPGLFPSRRSLPRAMWAGGCRRFGSARLARRSLGSPMGDAGRKGMCKFTGPKCPVMHQVCAGKTCTRAGFIGEVAYTSLVFNFQFSFDCSFSGGVRDSHNSFQLVSHGANPVPPLPCRGSLELGRSPCGEEEEGSCCRRESGTSPGTLSRAAQEVTHVLCEWGSALCPTPGFTQVGKR